MLIAWPSLMRGHPALQSVYSVRCLHSNIEDVTINCFVTIDVPINQPVTKILKVQLPTMKQRSQQNQSMCTVVGPGTRQYTTMRPLKTLGRIKLNLCQRWDFMALMKLVRNAKRISDE